MSTSSVTLLLCVRWLVLACAALLIGVVAYHAASIQPLAAPRLGVRGRNRMQARASGLFLALEPMALILGGFLRGRGGERLRSYMEKTLQSAAQPCGFDVDELLGWSVLSGFFGGGVSMFLLQMADADWSLYVLTAALMLALPTLKISSASKERAEKLERSLPAAMDLCVLCMGAGADFPQSLRFCVREMGDAHQVCQQELSQMLDELSLGRTRIEALTAFGARTESHGVQDFVASLCQSEEKGTPLIEALTIQASTLRQRRSVIAEERAAKAAVMLMLPLVLIMAGIFLLILGPLILNGTGL